MPPKRLPEERPPAAAESSAAESSAAESSEENAARLRPQYVAFSANEEFTAAAATSAGTAPPVTPQAVQATNAALDAGIGNQQYNNLNLVQRPQNVYEGTDTPLVEGSQSQPAAQAASAASATSPTQSHYTQLRPERPPLIYSQLPPEPALIYGQLTPEEEFIADAAATDAAASSAGTTPPVAQQAEQATGRPGADFKDRLNKTLGQGPQSPKPKK